MFDERRRGAGIDRSNPLKPLPATTKTSLSNSTVAPTRNGNAAAGRRQTPAATVRRNLTKRVDTFHHSNDELNGNATQKQMASTFDQTDHIMNETFPKAFSTMSLTEQNTETNGFNERNNNDYSRTKSSNSIKLKPVLTKKSPTVSSTRTVTSPQGSAGKVRATPRAGAVTSNAQKKTATSQTTVKVGYLYAYKYNFLKFEKNQVRK